MPLRRIDDDTNTWPKRPCTSPEHNPPGLISLPPGLYEHECPQCGAKQRFRVPEPPMLRERPKCPPNVVRVAGLFGWRNEGKEIKVRT